MKTSDRLTAYAVVDDEGTALFFDAKNRRMVVKAANGHVLDKIDVDFGSACQKHRCPNEHRFIPHYHGEKYVFTARIEYYGPDADHIEKVNDPGMNAGACPCVKPLPDAGP